MTQESLSSMWHPTGVTLPAPDAVSGPGSVPAVNPGQVVPSADGRSSFGAAVIGVRRVASRPRINKMLRYAITSGVSTGISEVTLLALYANGFLGATGSSVVANLAGTIPSYLMSRYWIWPEADRSGTARQMGLYWATAAVSLVLSAAGTSMAAAHAPAGHGAHVIVVGVAYVGTYAVLWVAKYLVYQHLVFRGAGDKRP
ncbi:MAG TPA: GtrA family protein [Candidatus Dormibacteraeota bacterium]